MCNTEEKGFQSRFAFMGISGFTSVKTPQDPAKCSLMLTKSIIKVHVDTHLIIFINSEACHNLAMAIHHGHYCYSNHGQDRCMLLRESLIHLRTIFSLFVLMRNNVFLKYPAIALI